MIPIIGLAALLAAPSTQPPPGLQEAVAAYDRAQVEGDGSALGRLLADDYILVNSAGVVESKAEFIGDSTAPGVKLEPFTVVQPVERFWTDGAVMGGLVRLTIHDHDVTSTACLRFADVWSRRGGAWQVAYTQAARAKDAVCG